MKDILVFLFGKSCMVMVKDQRAHIAHSESWNDYFLFSIKTPQIARGAKPGQFVMVRVHPHLHPLLRRPFSIHSRLDGNIEIFFQKSGTGTAILAEKKPGETLDLLGPCGKGFHLNRKLAGKTAVLVGGGRGIAPLYFLAQELASAGASLKVFYGGKSVHDLCLKEKFEKSSFELFCSTEDGTHGARGLVTELLASELRHIHPDYLFACGPEAMMGKIARLTAKRRIPAQFSLESIMGCGFGACWGCVRKIKKNGKAQLVKICEEGPVFRREEIVW